MSRIDVKNVWKIYDEEVVGVKDLTFCCNNKEFLAILGPSGGGKSSTLRMLAGLEEISKGEVHFDGKKVNALGPAERNVALAFESYALYQRLSVYENIAFPLKARKFPRKDIDKKVRQMADLMDLNPILETTPGSLAGGQQQRVSLARAFVRSPNLTLLDEPISHMDQRVRMELRARIRRLHDELGLTTIYVTHDQAEAISLCDRVLIVNKAELQQIGTVDEVWNRPANKFVAFFVGEPAMNFIDATIENDSNLSIATKGNKWVLPFEGELNLKNGNKNVTLGLRPQEIQVARSPKKQNSAVTGTVKVTEFLGYTTVLAIDLDDKDNTEIKIVVEATEKYENGEKVSIVVPPESVHLFDGELPVLKRKLTGKTT